MPTDLRKYSRQTDRRLLIGFFILLFIVGLGSIYIFWGPESAVTGLICIGLVLVPAVLVWLLLSIMGWIVRKVDQ
jgi:hypothetical protein